QYVTDVMGPTQLFAGSMGLFNRFQAFVIAKYNLGNGGLGNMGACEQETTAAEAQAVKKQYLTVLLPGFKALDTGWNYRLQPPGGATQGLSDLPPEPTQFLAARTSKR
ncbi:MAG TPA: hypothetical protein VJS43_17270, partial [Candidatus Acidoferrales bacterium]|nr:hypothetical protein [Candidatus Acidoferrales bacterium]